MTVLTISNHLAIAEDELEFSSIRAQGAGGQNVNKVSTAVHLRFDIRLSSLPPAVKQKLLTWDDSRISKDGVVVIKAQSYRSQPKNKAEALTRLKDLVLRATAVAKPRKPTKPSRSSQRKRLESKKKHSRLKALRNRVD